MKTLKINDFFIIILINNFCPSYLILCVIININILGSTIIGNRKIF